MRKILVYGYGNPGRQDDGLGPVLIERLNADQIPDIVTDCNYQLQVEDAIIVSQNDIVIFVDAATEANEPFTFTDLEPMNGITFTTHSISAGYILALCHELFNKTVKAYILAIRGYGWDFIEKLTPGAEKNLELAHRFLRQKIIDIMNESDTVVLY